MTNKKMEVYVLRHSEIDGYVVAVFGERLLRVQYDEFIRRSSEFDLLNCKVNKRKKHIILGKTDRVAIFYDENGNRFSTCEEIGVVRLSTDDMKRKVVDMKGYECRLSIRASRRILEKEEVIVKNANVGIIGGYSPVEYAGKLHVRFENCSINIKKDCEIVESIEKLELLNCIVEETKEELVGCKMDNVVLDNCMIHRKKGAFLECDIDCLNIRGCTFSCASCSEVVNVGSRSSIRRLEFLGNKGIKSVKSVRFSNCVMGDVYCKGNDVSIWIGGTSKCNLVKSSEDNLKPVIRKYAEVEPMCKLVVVKDVEGAIELMNSSGCRMMVVKDTDDKCKSYMAIEGLEEYDFGMKYLDKVKIGGLMARLEITDESTKRMMVFTSNVE